MAIHKDTQNWPWQYQDRVPDFFNYNSNCPVGQQVRPGLKVRISNTYWVGLGSKLVRPDLVPVQLLVWLNKIWALNLETGS